MIVQFLLSSRMGTRELEDDEVDPNAFEVPREVMNKYGRGPLPPKSQIESDIAHMKENKESRITITDLDPDTVLDLINYIYSGKVAELDGKATGLLSAAEKYDLKVDFLSLSTSYSKF